jgi:hypothetical protein
VVVAETRLSVPALGTPAAGAPVALPADGELPPGMGAPPVAAEATPAKPTNSVAATVVNSLPANTRLARQYRSGDGYSSDRRAGCMPLCAAF